MIRWMKNIRDNVKWSRAKGLVVYGPDMFGHHFVYVDNNFKVAIFLPKSDRTLHILIGDPVQANWWMKYDPSGNEEFNKNLSGKEFEWKIDRDRIRYRGTALKSPAYGQSGKVINSYEFTDLIDQDWILNKKQKMYNIYKKGELPITARW